MKLLLAILALAAATTCAAQAQVANRTPPTWGAPPADRPIALKVGTLLDGKGGIARDTVVVIAGGRIDRVGGALPPDARVYDLGNLTVTPGLIDTHVHVTYHFRHDRFVDNRLAGQDEPVPDSVLFAAENGVRLLDAGFTTVQSLGPGTAWDVSLREAWARNVLAGPRLLIAAVVPLRSAGRGRAVRGRAARDGAPAQGAERRRDQDLCLHERARRLATDIQPGATRGDL